MSLVCNFNVAGGKYLTDLLRIPFQESNLHLSTIAIILDLSKVN
jgi:hypothetical protein